MVERSVRDAEAASSNLVASTYSFCCSFSYTVLHRQSGAISVRPIGQEVKTEPSHGSIPGSIPGSVISVRAYLSCRFCFPLCCIAKIFEAWLSLVERSVRDAEAASSNLVASTYSFCCSFSYTVLHRQSGAISVRPIGQEVKTEPSHGSIPGSIPGSVILSFCSAVGSATHS